MRKNLLPVAALLLGTLFLFLANGLHSLLLPVRGTTEGYSTTDPSWRPYTVRQRFSCTFDAGARLIIPIWRFNLFGDFTYYCYLTDNFRAGEFRPSRSYMGLGVGLSFNF